MEQTVLTQLQWAAEMARGAKDYLFRSLAHNIGVDFLREAFKQIKPGKAPGIDGVTKKQYETQLEENLATLHTRLKEQRYRAPAVRRAWIPKIDGSRRPLGIPTLEDKIAQGAVKMYLEAIYEQDFYDCSYGFRPGRSCHQALSKLRTHISQGGMRYLIDADIKQCFESFDHQQLQDLLKRRVIDGSIKRLVGKWLNAGVMDGNEVIFPEHGTPQGGVISPLLANIYLHYVLDEWIEQDVKSHCKGAIALVRYADDFIISCELQSDAQRIMEVLPQRFAKYGLTIHPDKTQLIDFTQPDTADSKGTASFAFLGFRLFWAKSRQGYWVVKKATDKQRLARTKKRIDDWCKRNRHAPVKQQHKVLSAKLKGHYNYYGVIGNYARLAVVYNYALQCWRKWLDRRGAKRRLTWERFLKLLDIFPLPTPRIVQAV